MKITVTHASSLPWKKELYDVFRALGAEHEIFLPQENIGESNTKTIIHNSGMVFAEVSYPSTGQGIELGWADAAGIPIVCMYKEGEHPPSALAYISSKSFQYSDMDDLKAKILLAITP